MSHPTPAHPFRVRLAAAGILLVLGAAGAATAAAQTTGPVVVTTDGFDIVTELRIGDDLFAGIDGGVGGVTYRIDLLDTSGFLVESVDVTADATGWASPAPLWRACGVSEGPDSEPYHYRRFEDAEDELDGQVLLLLATEKATGVPFAMGTLPLVAERSTPRFYFSDREGNPRFKMEEGEEVFLTAIHLPPEEWTTLEVFVLDSQAHWQEDAPLVDVRTGGSGQVFSAWGGEPFTLPLLYRAEYCTYGYIQAPDFGGGEPPPFDEDGLLDPVTEIPIAGTDKPWLCLPCMESN